MLGLLAGIGLGRGWLVAAGRAVAEGDGDERGAGGEEAAGHSEQVRGRHSVGPVSGSAVNSSAARACGHVPISNQ